MSIFGTASKGSGGHVSSAAIVGAFLCLALVFSMSKQTAQAAA